MKCKRFRPEGLRNDEWFQFFTEFKTLIEQYTAEELDIEALFTTFVVLYQNADEAMTIIRKSATTEQLADADHLRDTTFRGLVDAVKSALKHFDPAKQQAAKNLKIILDQFGNVARKTFDQETASIYNLMQELHKRAADVTLLNMTDWLTQLEQQNKAFESLMLTRYGEEAAKTTLRVAETRAETDRCYRSILDRVDALILLNGEAKLAPFVHELAIRADRFERTLNQRKGRHASASPKDEAAEDTASEQ